MTKTILSLAVAAMRLVGCATGGSLERQCNRMAYNQAMAEKHAADHVAVLLSARRAVGDIQHRTRRRCAIDLGYCCDGRAARAA